MNASLLAPSEVLRGNPKKKKRVLLVDTSRPQRDLRSEIMRKLGIEVDCAADVVEARVWWRADLYDLVLINVPEGSGRLNKLCDDMRSATPAQQIMFLVGKPEYLATEPKTDSTVTDEQPPLRNAETLALPSCAPGGAERWGILEACRRISAVRHASQAKAQALRNRPLPPRDSEMQQSRADKSQFEN